MISRTPRLSDVRRERGYWVEAPRVTDSIGFALRNAYGRDLQITAELEKLLNKLGGVKDGGWDRAAGR